MFSARPLQAGPRQASLPRTARSLQLAAPASTTRPVPPAASQNDGEPPGDSSPLSPGSLPGKPGSRSAWRWRSRGRLSRPASAVQHASGPAQQISGWGQLEPKRPSRFSPEMLVLTSQQAKTWVALTERTLVELQEECPGQVDAAQVSLITQYMAEGRRVAEEIRLLAQKPSQNPREAIIYALAIMMQCSAWCRWAQEQIERSLQTTEQLRQSTAGEAGHAPPARGTEPAQPPHSDPKPPAPAP